MSEKGPQRDKNSGFFQQQEKIPFFFFSTTRKKKSRVGGGGGVKLGAVGAVGLPETYNFFFGLIPIFFKVSNEVCGFFFLEKSITGSLGVGLDCLLLVQIRKIIDAAYFLYPHNDEILVFNLEQIQL